MSPDPGLTEPERALLRLLADTWNGYCQLPDRAHADDLDFNQAIHTAQRLIAIRVARRVDPDFWRQPRSSGEIRKQSKVRKRAGDPCPEGCVGKCTNGDTYPRLLVGELGEDEELDLTKPLRCIECGWTSCISDDA